MRPGVGARPGRAATMSSPGTDPVSLLITTAAVVLGLLALGLPTPVRPGPPARAAAGPSRHGRSSGAALRLLAGAAIATSEVAYQGVEMVDSPGPGGTGATLADIWHQPGQEPVLQAAAPAGDWRYGWTYQAAFAAPAGRGLAVLGLSQRLVGLLRTNYVVTLGGRSEVAGRPALLVTVRRPDGSLAARIWLDQATRLPLGRETFDGGRPLGGGFFLSLAVGQTAGPTVRSRPVPVWHQVAAGQLAALRARGWPLPAPLPCHLTLLGARLGPGPAGPVVHLAYSDGLSAVSLFVERGSLAPGLHGWSRGRIGGQQVYRDDPDDNSIVWSAHGFVFTLIAQAPQWTVRSVVAALPHGAAPASGIVARVRTGAARLLAWLGARR